ncbi:MAG: hypothetical protein ABIC40_01160, partial [bacterium]
MSRFTFGIAIFIAGVLSILGCSGSGSPLAPDNPSKISNQNSTVNKSSQTHLWGFYNVYIDVDAKTAAAIPDRVAMFTVNTVNFLNGNASNMGFKINEILTGTDYTDVDIDVTLKHPFPGLPQYNGYDVRGIFMGDGSEALSYNSDLEYPVDGVDQMMLPNPATGFGPDGYTRWFNKPEFSGGGMPLFQYTQGKLATPGYSESATLNAYKYFADSLSTDENLWDWLAANADQYGVLSSGTSTTRNYYLRFPKGKGVAYSYAVIADWGGTDVHPSNAAESVAVNVADNSTVYYASPSDKGGNIKLDISVWNWGASLTGGIMDEYRIVLESTVLSNPWFSDDPSMTPIGGDENYSTYQIDVPADNVTGISDQEYWVIVEE